MRTGSKILGKVCLKAIRVTFLSNIWSIISGRAGSMSERVGDNFLVGDINRWGDFGNFGHKEGALPYPSLPPPPLQRSVML